MFNAPMSQNRAQYLINTLELLPQQTIVDFGCGDGMFLQLLAFQTPIIGYGIDNNDTLIQNAQTNWDSADHNNKSSLKFISMDANDYIRDMTPVDAIICIGAEYVFGGYGQLLEQAKSLLRPNGKLIVGTIYWKQPPSSEYLALLGNENPYHDLHNTVQMAYQAGYLPLDIGRANSDEWDRFESSTARRRYKNTTSHDSIWQWQSGYFKWGMDTMGFSFLLLEKSQTSTDT